MVTTPSYLQIIWGISIFVRLSIGQVATCNPNDKVYRALKRNIENGSDSFCRELIDKVEYIGTLREPFTIPEYVTVTDSATTLPATTYIIKTVSTKTTSTSYSSQPRRTGSSFTQPLPTYIEQFPTPRVISACSCITEPYTYTQYRVCEPTSYSSTTTTFTYTVPKSGRKTKSVTFTDTFTSTASAKAGFPDKCPKADGVDYVGKDHSVWERGCNTYLNQYREIDTITASDFTNCIDKCVEYNVQRGYKQCQAVVFVKADNSCMRINQPGYFAHPDGNAAVATLRFIPPTPSETDYCASLSPTPTP